jgi:hypothetical protein
LPTGAVSLGGIAADVFLKPRPVMTVGAAAMVGKVIENGMEL